MPDPQDPPETPPGGPNTGGRATASINDAITLARIDELKELQRQIDSKIQKLKAKLQE